MIASLSREIKVFSATRAWQSLVRCRILAFEWR